MSRWFDGGFDIEFALADERRGVPAPRSVAGRQIRSEARAFLAELNDRSKPAGRPLYCGGGVVGPVGIGRWTESLRDARSYAARFPGGRVYEMPREHARGLRMVDYIPDDPLAPRQWIIWASVRLVEEREP